MKVDMGFCLVAQPWTYNIIGGPSKLPQDFPWPIPNHSGPPQITPAHPSSYFMTGPLLCLCCSRFAYYTL